MPAWLQGAAALAGVGIALLTGLSNYGGKSGRLLSRLDAELTILSKLPNEAQELRADLLEQAAATSAAYLARETRRRKRRIDWVGMGTATFLLLLAIALALGALGTSYPWWADTLLGLCIAFVVLVAGVGISESIGREEPAES